MSHRYGRGEARDAGNVVYTLNVEDVGLRFVYGQSGKDGDWTVSLRSYPSTVVHLRKPSKKECETWINDVVRAYDRMARFEPGAAENWHKVLAGRRAIDVKVHRSIHQAALSTCLAG